MTFRSRTPLTDVSHRSLRCAVLAPRSMRHIFHPTDLATDGEVAFQHALRIALAVRGSLTVMHVTDGGDAFGGHLPKVRRMLVAWGLLADEHDEAGLRAMGVGVKKVVAGGADPVEACLAHLDRHPTDLVVLATHQRGGRMVWGARPVAEPLARGARGRTLLLPAGKAGFLDPATGRLRLQRVLVPVGDDREAAASVASAVAMASSLGLEQVEFGVLHVGAAGAFPQYAAPQRPGWAWVPMRREGPLVQGILDAADALQADLIVMTTHGHDGFLDALRGSTTERVLRRSRCPLLSSISA